VLKAISLLLQWLRVALVLESQGDAVGEVHAQAGLFALIALNLVDQIERKDRL
jgi:hypothetical protein